MMHSIIRKILFVSLLFSSTLGQTNTLLIGSSPMNPPFENIADGQEQFFGFDINIMSEICNRMKKKCQFKPVPFNDLFPKIKSGALDLAISAIIVTPKREQNFLFSLPYLKSDVQFMALKGSTIKNAEDIKGKVVGIRAGTPFGGLTQEIYGTEVKMKTYPLVSGLLTALQKKDVDVIMLDANSVVYWEDNFPNQYQPVGAPISIGNGYAIMANQKSKTLIQAINQILLEMEQDGTYLKIYKNYF